MFGNTVVTNDLVAKGINILILHLRQSLPSNYNIVHIYIKCIMHDLVFFYFIRNH